MMAEKYAYEYAALAIDIQVGGTIYSRVCPDFTLTSRRDSPVRLLEFEVGNVKSPALGGLYSGKIQPGMEVVLSWSLDQETGTIFRGQVEDAADSKTVRAWARDDGRKLLDVRTTVNTRGETTAQILKRLAGAAGLAPGHVSTTFDVGFPHWVAAGETIQEAILKLVSTLEHSFGRDVGEIRWWVDAGGSFHWGAWDDEVNGRNECAKPLELRHTTNILELDAPKSAGERGRVLTHAWPFFDHSMLVTITDERLAKISGREFRIEEVRHLQRGFQARTELFFKAV